MDLKIQLSDEELTALQKFREIFKNEPSIDKMNDYFLLRWLIARNFDLPKAEKMLRNSMTWRTENMDHILENIITDESILKHISVGVVSRYKSGNPVFIGRIGLMDFRGLVESFEPSQDLNYYIKLLESIFDFKSADDKINGKFVQVTAIADLQGFGIRHMTVPAALDCILKLCKVYEANYPEIVKKAFVINAPKIFDLLFSLVKPLLSEKTLSKLSIFGNDPDIWKPALLAEIPAEILPVSYGGTMTDPIDGNPDCSSLVNMGGMLPTSLYLANKQTKLIKSNETGTFVINSRSKKFLEIQINQADTILEWEFHCEEGDLAFGITKKTGDDDSVLIPKNRVNCHISKEHGQFHCNEPGSYVMEFDNTFSYLTSKSVCFFIRMSEK